MSIKETEITNLPINESNFIMYGSDVYRIALYHEELKEFDPQTAYLIGDYFYVYRGILDPIGANNLPGIYFDIEKKKYILIHPNPNDPMECEMFDYTKRMSTYDPQEIVRMLNERKVEILNIPEGSKQFVPTLGETDDILKRLIKMAILTKDIDIDSYRSRFVDKNALFNFKQVLKSEDTRLSVLLFDRGMEALNLRYTILIDEIDPANPIGKPLAKTIVASSEDTYDL